MDLAAADVPRGPAAHRQPPGPQARPQDTQKYACQARDDNLAIHPGGVANLLGVMKRSFTPFYP